MTYKATLKVQFDTEWTSTHYSSGFDDSMLPEEHYTFQVPAEDLNVYQLFRFFATVARAMGHDELNIMKGGCGLAFSEERNPKDMRKVADEFELTLAEDLQGKFEDWKKAEEDWARLKKGPMGTVLPDDEKEQLKLEILDLKAKLSRCQHPDNPQYTDEEMDAMTYQEWNGSVPGSSEAVEKGCKCPVMDNKEMPEELKWVNGDCPLHGKVK